MSKSKQLTLKKLQAHNTIWHPESTLVFKSVKERIVIGRYVDNQLIPLDPETLELCKKFELTPDESLIKEEEEPEEEEPEPEETTKPEEEEPEPEETTKPEEKVQEIIITSTNQSFEFVSIFASQVLSSLTSMQDRAEKAELETLKIKEQFDSLQKDYDVIKKKFDMMKSLFA